MANILGNLLTGNQGQVDKGFNQMGIPVAANQGGFSGQPAPIRTGAGLPGPVGTHNPLEPGGTIKPVTPTLPQGAIPYQQAYTNTSGSGNLLPSNLTAPPPVPGATPPATTPGQAAPFSNMTPQQQQELQKQLIDTFGKGEGNLLYSLIGSIGGSDDAYMQAYEKAMAGPNAEALAALNTSFGNSGISMNSSAAAIGNADFQSNIVAQEGLQVQQLKMNDLAQLMGLTQGLQKASAAEVASGGWEQILGAIVSAIPGLQGIGKGLSQIGSQGGGGGGAAPLDTTGGADPLGLNAPSTAGLPTGTFGGDQLPDLATILDSGGAASADAAAAGVFI